MKKYFFSVLVLFTFISTVNFAQFKNIERVGGLARIQSMGESPYMIDPYFITFNPAWAAVYSNFVWGDLGADNGTADDGTGQFLGANLKVASPLTVGLILSRSDFPSAGLGVQIAGIDPYGTIGGFVNQNFVVALQNNMEVLAAFSLASNMHLGLGVSYASSTKESSPAGANATTGSASQLGINAGLLASFGGLGMDFGFAVLMPGATYEPGVGNTSEISRTIINANARIFVPIRKQLDFVPMVSFTTSSGTFDNGTVSSDLSTITQFAIGAGMNYHYEDFLFTGGVAFENQSNTTASTNNVPEVSDSRTAFPVWNLGAEWNFTSWMAGRIGYRASEGNITDQEAATTTTTNESVTTFYGPTGFTLGIGLKFDKFSLSATVNERVLHQGFNNIGGGTPTLGYLSATVAF